MIFLSQSATLFPTEIFAHFTTTTSPGTVDLHSATSILQSMNHRVMVHPSYS